MGPLKQRTFHEGFFFFFLHNCIYFSLLNKFAGLIGIKYSLRFYFIFIVGKDEGLGMKNLRCAGTIAGESSQAYRDIVTISMVMYLLLFKKRSSYFQTYALQFFLLLLLLL